MGRHQWNFQKEGRIMRRSYKRRYYKKRLERRTPSSRIKQTRRARHNWIVESIYKNPQLLKPKLRELGIEWGEVIFQDPEPDLLTWKRKVDLVFVIKTRDFYFIILIEVKGGYEGAGDGLEQLHVVYKSLKKDGDWTDWLDDKLEDPQEKDVWLVQILVRGEDEILVEKMIASAYAEKQELGRYFPLPSTKVLVLH